MKEVVYSFEMSIDFPMTTQDYIPQDKTYYIS